MPTIQQQLNQLKKDKETLNTMLNTMGVETTGNETFTELTPLVGKIVTDPILQDKIIEITENGTTTIIADENYDGLNSVEVTTNISGGGGDTTQEDGIITKTLTSYSNNRVTKVGSNIFESSFSLETVNLPNVTIIGNGAFRGCSKLSQIEIPNATSVGSETFYACTNLTTVNFPNVTTIGESIFGRCKALTSVHLPNLTSISNSAFSDCTVLKTITLSSVKTVNTSAFYNCSKLKKVDLHTVEAIKNNAFYLDGVLETIIIRSNTMCALSNKNAFTSTPIASGTGYIYVPSALIEDYKTDTNWVTYDNQFRAIEDYPEICGEVTQ